MPAAAGSRPLLGPIEQNDATESRPERHVDGVQIGIYVPGVQPAVSVVT